MNATFTYYSGETALSGPISMPREVVRAMFPTGAIKRLDGYSLLVGRVEHSGVTGQLYPVTRIIRHNPAGKNHKCDRRCTHAKGNDCECQCGGRFHGLHR